MAVACRGQRQAHRSPLPAGFGACWWAPLPTPPWPALSGTPVEGYFDDYEDEQDYTAEGDPGTEEEEEEEQFDSDVDEHDLVLEPHGVSPQRPRATPPPPPPKRDTLPAAAAAAAAASVTPPPPPPPPLSRTAIGCVTSSPPLTLELLGRFRSIDPGSGRLRVSLRLERQVRQEQYRTAA
jgi:hypothetical protein